MRSKKEMNLIISSIRAVFIIAASTKSISNVVGLNNTTTTTETVNATVTTAKSMLGVERGREAFQTKTIIQMAVHLIIFLFGTIGNMLLVAVILRKRSMRCAANWLVFNLAISDLGITLFNIPLTNMYHFRGWPFGENLCKYFLGAFGECIVGVSVFTHTALALIRYHVVSNPMVCNIKLHHVQMGIALIWVLAYSSLSAPLTGKFKLVHSPVIKDDVCKPAWPSFEYKLSYRACVFVITYFIPMIIATFCYLKIFRKLRHSMKFLRSGNSASASQIHRREHKSQRLTRTLFVLYTIFATITLPLEVFYVLVDTRAIPINTYSAHVWSLLVALFYSLSVVNPILLFYMSEEYRNQLYGLWPGRNYCFKRKEESHSEKGSKNATKAGSYEVNQERLLSVRTDSNKGVRIENREEENEIQDVRPQCNKKLEENKATIFPSINVSLL